MIKAGNLDENYYDSESHDIRDTVEFKDFQADVLKFIRAEKSVAVAKRESARSSSGDGPWCCGATCASTTSRVPRRRTRHATRNGRSSSIAPLDVQVVNR